MADLKAFAGLLARFGLAGLASTVVGFAVIAGLDAGLHVPPPLANAAGYLVGIPLGFALNRGFVFRHGGALGPTGLKYLAMVAGAFALNQLTLRAAGAILGPGDIQHLAAQLCGMAVYTGATFVVGRLWVFREP